MGFAALCERAGSRGGAARTFLLQLQNALRPRYVRNHFAGVKEHISGRNIARDLSVTVDVGFCQIGKYQAIRFAA
jgi:hypothetical protein